MTRSWALFLTARRTGNAVLTLVVLGVIERLLGTASVRFTGNNSFVVPWAVVVPTVAAAAVALASGSATPELEQLTVRNIPRLRLTHASAVVLFATITDYLGTRELGGTISSEAAVRNVLGLAGLALLGATIFGAIWAWILPAVIALISLTAGVTDGTAATWAWPLANNANSGAWVIAVALLVVGLASISARGARAPSPDEDDE